MLQIGNSLLTEVEEETHFALWAFAKAPLIIGADLDKISDHSLAILKNKNLIAINQDTLGNQVQCVQGCDPKAPSTMQVYQSLVITSDKDSLQMAVLGVNWDDADNQDLTLDLVGVGIATDANNSCTITDLYTGEVKAITGAPQTFTGIAPHSHVAKKIKCLPW